MAYEQFSSVARELILRVYQVQDNSPVSYTSSPVHVHTPHWCFQNAVLLFPFLLEVGLGPAW